jgi:preprotein translocase subunit SecE
VSDERDGADAAAEATETEERSGGRTAVATRPQRPSGKMSRRRADAEDGVADAGPSAVAGVVDEDSDAAVKNDKKAKKAKKSPGPNPVAYLYNYLKQVIAELRKVIWPNRKQMITYTSVVLAFLMFMVALVALADLGLAKLVLLVFG